MTGIGPRYPFDFAAAHHAARVASEAQHEHEQALTRAHRDYAQKERVYRVALARRLTELRAEGLPATLIADLARGDERVAELKYERDLADGVCDAVKQAAWAHNADRKDLLVFLDWSKRASFLDLERAA